MLRDVWNRQLLRVLLKKRSPPMSSRRAHERHRPVDEMRQRDPLRDGFVGYCTRSILRAPVLLPMDAVRMRDADPGDFSGRGFLARGAVGSAEFWVAVLSGYFARGFRGHFARGFGGGFVGLAARHAFFGATSALDVGLLLHVVPLAWCFLDDLARRLSPCADSRTTPDTHDAVARPFGEIAFRDEHRLDPMHRRAAALARCAR